MAIINLTSIMQKVVVAAAKDKKLESLAWGSALGRVTILKHGLIRDFEDHGVTREILRGPTARSSFLSRGNLHSFIGFYTQGDQAGKQIKAVKNILVQSITVRKHPHSKVIKGDEVTTQFAYTMPDLNEIWKVTPYPNPPPLGKVKRSGSWMQDLEARGIDGFQFYLYFGLNRKKANRSARSRSRTALQVKGSINSGGVSPIDYMTALLMRFKNAVEKKGRNYSL